MVTRIYIPSSGTPGSTPTVYASWAETGSGFFRAPLVTTKSNTTLTNVAHSALTLASQNSVLSQHISDTLDSDQTISGTADFILRGKEGSTNQNSYLAICLRVMQGDTSTERGVLAYITGSYASGEWGTGFRTRIRTSISLTSVNALAGDRIVADIGTSAVSPVGAPVITYTYGDVTATADFALTSNLTTNLDPWLEFSQNITFGTPGGGGATQPPRTMHQFRQRRSA